MCALRCHFHNGLSKEDSYLRHASMFPECRECFCCGGKVIELCPARLGDVTRSAFPGPAGCDLAAEAAWVGKSSHCRSHQERLFGAAPLLCQRLLPLSLEPLLTLASHGWNAGHQCKRARINKLMMPEGCLRVVETTVNCTLNRQFAIILCKYATRTYGFQ